MNAGVALLALLADLEDREARVRFTSAGGSSVTGVIIAGNREVCWVRDTRGVVHYILLGATFEIVELERRAVSELN